MGRLRSWIRLESIQIRQHYARRISTRKRPDTTGRDSITKVSACLYFFTKWGGPVVLGARTQCFNYNYPGQRKSHINRIYLRILFPCHLLSNTQLVVGTLRLGRVGEQAHNSLDDVYACGTFASSASGV